MNRTDAYFEQLVEAGDVDLWFDNAEAADQALAGAIGLYGLCQGGDVTEKAGTPNLSVSISAPMVAYDSDGNRIAIAALTNVPVSVDENSTSTTVATGGHERYLSIFVTFDRALSDPRLDGLGDTVYYVRAESYTIEVVQAASAPLGTASRPALRGGSILLADVKLINGQTSVLNADIYTDRTEYVHLVTGSPNSFGARTPTEAMQLLQDQINDIINGVVTVAASSVTYAGGAAWLDTLTNPATTVELQLDKIVTDLSDITGVGANGASRIGFAPQGTIAATTVETAIVELDTGLATLIPSSPATVTRFVNAANFTQDSTADGTLWLGGGLSGPVVGLAVHPGTVASESTMTMPIDHILPDGATITQIRVRLNPGGTNAGTDRASAQLFVTDITGTQYSSGIEYDTGSGVAQWVTVSGLSVVVDKTQRSYAIAVKSSATIAHITAVYGAEVTYTAAKKYVD